MIRHPGSHFIISTMITISAIVAIFKTDLFVYWTYWEMLCLSASGGLFYAFREIFQWVRGRLDFGHWGGIVAFVLGSPNPNFDLIGLIYGVVPGFCGMGIFAASMI